MDIVDPNAALLSNFEVYQLLSEIRETSKTQKRSFRPQALSTLVYETLKYFDQSSPCVEYKADKVVEFLTACKQFNLTKAELMQMLNSRPVSAVEVQLIVEECEERLTEQQVDDLLQVIQQHLPAKKEHAATSEAAAADVEMT